MNFNVSFCVTKITYLLSLGSLILHILRVMLDHAASDDAEK